MKLPPAALKLAPLAGLLALAACSAPEEASEETYAAEEAAATVEEMGEEAAAEAGEGGDMVECDLASDTAGAGTGPMDDGSVAGDPAGGGEAAEGYGAGECGVTMAD